MSTISYIPGRVRIESRELINQPRRCALVAQGIKALAGVSGVEISQRTGRVLVRFDEEQIDRDLLLARLDALINNADASENWEATHLTAGGTPVTNKKQILSHLAVDLASHVLLPGPLGVLFPFAMNAFRRSPA